MEFDFSTVQSELGVVFDNPDLLIQAFTHKSFSNEHGGCPFNERLEFLGDSVLQLAVSKVLYEQNPEMSEGKLSKLRSSIVSQKPLADIVDRLGVFKYLRLGKGLSSSGFLSDAKPKPRSDLFESVLGAIFLDGGMEKAEAFLARVFFPYVKPEPDFKTDLQNFVANGGGTPPEYVSTEREDKSFVCTVTVGGREFKGYGGSKHDSEIAAARAALSELYSKR